jgi:hypothetical protein
MNRGLRVFVPAQRIVAFSAGNVYGLTPAEHGGRSEGDMPQPVGENAMSCLGRERSSSTVSAARPASRRAMCECLGRLMHRRFRFARTESDPALLSNALRGLEWLGPPRS